MRKFTSHKGRIDAMGFLSCGGRSAGFLNWIPHVNRCYMGGAQAAPKAFRTNNNDNYRYILTTRFVTVAIYYIQGLIAILGFGF
jgi:hypothetical protein